MDISKACIDLIKQYEGLKLKPYICPAGVPTIGYGSTYYEDGTKVKMTDPEITAGKAETLLINTLKGFIDCVKSSVKKELTQHQLDALVSFTYNVGCAALRDSTLLKKVNINPNDPTIKDEFNKWVRSKGTTLEGLVKRRKSEYAVYTHP